jgi:hypothetical protein
MRALVFLTVLGLAASTAAGCRGLRIENDRLLCGHGECPYPYQCNVSGRCSLDRDASADATDGNEPHEDGPTVDASDGVDGADGAGADRNGGDGPSNDVADGPIADGPDTDRPGIDTAEVGPDGPVGGTYLLSVTTGGPSGAGMVLSTTAGVAINCGQTCSALVAAGTSVQLVASPAASGSFSAWTGCTSVDTTTCTVVATTATTVMAAFKLKNGVACAQTGDCATGFCVSNVCCATPCTGPCNGSCSTGTCLPLPTRTACGNKTGQGGPGVGSDVSLVCDGLGACKAPTISCPVTGGDVPCDLNTKSCCHISFSLPNAGTLTCTTPSSCATPDEGDNFDGYSCGQGSDCPLNKVCCERRYMDLYDWAICLDSCDPGTDIMLP